MTHQPKMSKGEANIEAAKREFIKQDIQNDSIQIVVLDRDFVFVGRITKLEDEDRTIIDDAHSIRRWGTDAGLGQLSKGPRTETILDPSGTVTIPNRAIVFFIEADPDGWAKVFPPFNNGSAA